LTDDLVKVVEASARSGFVLVFSSALSTIILAVVSILVAGFLGSELYGQYYLALVIPQILFQFSDLCLSQGDPKKMVVLKHSGLFEITTMFKALLTAFFYN
jgi:hypothetical protein